MSRGSPGMGATLFSARSLPEYSAMFGLRTGDLERTILDCPGGAGSLVAEARRRGGCAVSVDPAYALPRERLVALALADAQRGNRYVADHAEDYTWGFFSSASHHDEVRTGSARAFVEDQARHPDSYVAAALPRLPFHRQTFDLVLSAHLLFTYTDRLDHRFHADSIRELVRVSRFEVRVFPLLDTNLRRYDRLEELRRELRSVGVVAEVRRVDYEFQVGGNEMLVCRSRA